MKPEHVPLSTYRLQFNHQFTFLQAGEIVDYLNELGISHIYASPIMQARSKSLHGYDLVDSNRLHSEVGNEAELANLCAQLKQREMGFILDIVPNHMCISEPANQWWTDLLENGLSSIYAGFFDIYWDHPKKELKHKILLPILTEPLSKAIEERKLKLTYQQGSFFLNYKDQHLPLDPKSWLLLLKPLLTQLKESLYDLHPALLELEKILKALQDLPETHEIIPEISQLRQQEKEAIKHKLCKLAHNPFFIQAIKISLQNFEQLELLLKEQNYCLIYWRLTNDLINYRRFFDINELVCLHTEKPEVFSAIHAKLFEFIQKGWVTGLRIDHIDGLYDPQAYLTYLQEMQPNPSKIYTVVEKILVGEEKLPFNWDTQGTTGYDYLNLVNHLFVMDANQSKMQQIYEQFIGFPQALYEITYQCKKLILSTVVSSELHLLAYRLLEISAQHDSSCDFSVENLCEGLRELIACFPVYRSYVTINQKHVSESDRKAILLALKMAKKINATMDSALFDFIQNVLLLQDPLGLTNEQRQLRRAFVMHFQQLTGPVMAKGVEDTAFYRACSLVSLNEVGSDLRRFGISLEEFHAANQERLRNWPYTLLTTFTHDTKRSEDVRMRLNVLSENPDKWSECVNKWEKLNAAKRIELKKCQVPSANEEYLLYQTLAGSWTNKNVDAVYIARIQNYMLKALREAKIHTNWVNPNEEYEKAMLAFIYSILDIQSNATFISKLDQDVQWMIEAGRLNSLSQLLLKMTVPGVPDFYQGSELWDLTLVDPDNRQPVDYAERKSVLSMLKREFSIAPAELIKELRVNLENGWLKMYVMWRVLNFRKQCVALFQEGEYLPLTIEGERRDNLVAFARKSGCAVCIVMTGRFFSQLHDLKAGWQDTHALVYEELEGNYRDVISGLEIKIEKRLLLSSVFTHFPFALLEKL